MNQEERKAIVQATLALIALVVTLLLLVWVNYPKDNDVEVEGPVVTPAEMTFKPELTFPRRVASRANSGDIWKVKLKFEINHLGEVTNVSIIESSGNKTIDRSALETSKEARFSPTLHDGEGVDSEAVWTIVYKME
ncbi:energy transducer TonB [Suttonella sp. R2A3]|uniref:energy transducer TonB n=1 Tax=Suttonella sp. R2A3 TaxID=2908648 RepID=UPI001F18127C|nr:energy transducer TonB [Suttonella sp. R2A3]UJF25163.1 energy transducer TonB [Suttonella sp. R2A3]